MAVFKCKMCGGALEVNNETVAVCEYCGTKQTLPRLNDERKANLYDRANHFRRNNEFDKAMGIYDQILNEDNTDAEAYWSLVLCRFGIEYVEDPSSHKRIPTINRAQYTSIFDDDNYKSALQYADLGQKELYENEAKAINEIQKGILAISQKEEPFDVFICYKETDNNGRRTPDSVLATDLYHLLTQEGFKVFFSRITLEDKLGSAYEPYIFAALNSAKIMVVLGTKPEYFNAVWVKNEWSRYLALIKNGAKKTLVPAYKDMDPYDLPEEFSHLQAQDMSKLGFMQDLIRGIKKIIGDSEPKQTVIKETVVTGAAVTNTAPLLKRAFMFLEDGDFERADDFSEQVLNQDPENAEAYLVKLMVDLKVKKREELKDLANPFDNYNNYQKVIRFANDNLQSEIKGYIDFIIDRNLNEKYNKLRSKMEAATLEREFLVLADDFKALGFKDSEKLTETCLEKAEEAKIKAEYNDAVLKMREANAEHAFKSVAKLFEALGDYENSKALADECYKKAEEAKIKAEYNDAVLKMREANAEHAFKSVAKLFEALGDYENSKALADECYKKAEIARKNSIYTTACNLIASNSISNYKAAIQHLETICGWRDSKEKIEECKNQIAKIEAEILEKERLAEVERIEEEKRVKRNKIIAIIATSVIAVIVVFVIVLNSVIIPNGKYNDAIALMDAGNIIEAYEALIALDGYKDSADKANSIYDKYKVEKLKIAKAGDYVFFGEYEQDNNTANGKEDVEWLVLEVKDGKALVISKYALDCKQYNTSRTDVTWETCTLRKWLNNDFINAAFSANEKAMIPTVTVSADKNPNYSTNPGNATQDQVFLLSITEANKYFSSDSARQCEPTDYAVANGAWESDSGNCLWWLRSPGHFENRAASVDSDGDVYEFGRDVDYDYDTVRPAMWIDLNKIK